MSVNCMLCQCIGIPWTSPNFTSAQKGTSAHTVKSRFCIFCKTIFCKKLGVFVLKVQHISRKTIQNLPLELLWKSV
jgi:hypothetical protein